MKAKIKKVGDTIVVSVDGKLDYETQEPFKEDLKKITKSKAGTDSTPMQVIFNMKKLEFVGSSGISQFIQTLKDFGNQNEEKTTIVHASSEFKKVMRAFDDEAIFEFHDNDDIAKKAIDH